MKKKQTTTNAAPTWAQPKLQEAANFGSQIFQQQQPNIDAMSDTLYGGFNQLAGGAFGDSPLVQSGQNYISDTLNGNPYLENAISASADDIRENVGGLFSRRGMYGSTPHQGVLGREIGRMSNNMRMGDMGRQMQAVGMIPALRQSEYAGISPLLSMASGASQIPFAGVNAYGNLMGNLIGNQGSTTQKSGGGFGQAVGAGLTLASLFSDARLKENVRRVGQTDAGQPIYTYNYKGSPTPQMGVMAQESPPEAVSVHPSGYLMVDYGKVA